MESWNMTRKCSSEKRRSDRPSIVVSGRLGRGGRRSKLPVEGDGVRVGDGCISGEKCLATGLVGESIGSSLFGLGGAESPLDKTTGSSNGRMFLASKTGALGVPFVLGNVGIGGGGPWNFGGSVCDSETEWRPLALLLLLDRVLSECLRRPRSSLPSNTLGDMPSAAGGKVRSYTSRDIRNWKQTNINTCRTAVCNEPPGIVGVKLTGVYCDFDLDSMVTLKMIDWDIDPVLHRQHTGLT